jgi:inosine/xanthosine triphosphatase
METIVVGSHNPVKLEAILRAFERMFPTRRFKVRGVPVDSGVADQPMSDNETFEGARNRMTQAKNGWPEADFWVGIEGGIEDRPDGMAAFAWITVLSTHRYGQARTATFLLPPKVAELIHQGVELGHANDQLFNRQNSKQQEGAIGTLTELVIDRRDLYEHAAIMALVPLKNEALYESPL